MNSSQRIAVERYAAAYDNLSRTNEEAARRASELSVAAQALLPVQTKLSAPSISLAQKKQVVSAALKEMGQVGAFVSVLLEEKRYSLLAAIVERVKELLDDRQGILRAKVLSAQPLSEEQQKKTQRILSARYGKTVQASFQINPALLGGLKIYCNGEMIDGSLQRQLNCLQEELIK